MSRWWIKIGRHARPQARELAGILALTLLGSAIGLLGPWPLKLIVDYVLPGTPLPESLAALERLPLAGSRRGLLALLAAGTILLFLGRRLVKVASTYLESTASTRMVYNLATELFHHLQRRSLLFHARQTTGDLVKRVTADTSCVRELVMGVALPLIAELATLVGMFVVMWGLDRRLALFAVLAAGPLVLIIRFFGRPMETRAYAVKTMEGQLSAVAEQALSAFPVVQAFGREDHETGKYRELAGRTMRANSRAVASQLGFNVSTGAMSALATASVMTIGAHYVLDGSLSVGSLLVLISYFSALYSPLESMAYLSESFANASAGARRVLDVLESQDEGVSESPDAQPLPARANPRGGHVRLIDVSFGYRPGSPVLHHIDLDVHPGEMVALVGRTGAGKSSLISLLSRLYDPWEGAVMLDGCDLRGCQLASLRRSVAVVPQEPFLLPLTAAENIAYGRPGATAAEIEAAARAAHAHDFITALADGYDTVIGGRGMTLSGGERQRIAIARALLMDARVLILDEPTSSLDADTEHLVLEALATLTAQATTFVIAHRLATVRRADRILVLEEGRIAASGSHQELSGEPGLYAELLALQQLDPSSADRRDRAEPLGSKST